MYARSSVIRGGGLCALTLSLFYGCGGLNEADYFPSNNGLTDGGIEAGSGRCGDGTIDPGEDCDGTELGGATCDKVLMGDGTYTGQVRCTRTCRFDTSRCDNSQGGNGGTGGNGTGGNGTGGRNGTGGTRPGTGGTGPGTGGTGPGTGGAGPGTGGVDVACTSNGDCTGNQICCAERANGALSSLSCRNRCGQQGFPIECGKASDCGNNQVCCGTLNANNAYTGIACAATCAQNGANEVTLCTQNSECSNGLTCQTSRLLTSDFKVCR